MAAYIDGIVRYSAPIAYGFKSVLRYVGPSGMKLRAEDPESKFRTVGLVRELTPKVFQKHPHLRDDILLLTKAKKKSDSGCSAAYCMGTKISPHAVVVVNEKYLSEVPDLAKHFIKHELGHIASNKNLIDDGLACLISTVITVAGSYLLSNMSLFAETEELALALMVCIIGWGVTQMVVHEGLPQIEEEREADQFAIQTSTPKELVAARQYYRIKAKLAGPIGELLADTHPSDQERAETVKVAIKERNIDTKTYQMRKLKTKVTEFMQKESPIDLSTLFNPQPHP